MVYSKDKIINITKFYRAKLDKERINKQMKKKKGFTLIELLVVIAIIGLLSTLAVVSLNGARAKARDASRLSALKQMSTAIEMERANLGDDTAFDAPCNAADQETDSCTGPGDISQFSNFQDPTGSGDGICTNASGAPCQYTISDEAGTGAPTLGNYQICSYLEQDSGNLTDGPIKVISGGVLSDACN